MKLNLMKTLLYLLTTIKIFPNFTEKSLQAIQNQEIIFMEKLEKKTPKISVEYAPILSKPMSSHI